MVHRFGGYGRSAFRRGDSGRSQQDSHTRRRLPLLCLLAAFSLLVQLWTSFEVPASRSLRLEGEWWKTPDDQEVTKNSTGVLDDSTITQEPKSNSSLVIVVPGLGDSTRIPVLQKSLEGMSVTVGRDVEISCVVYVWNKTLVEEATQRVGPTCSVVYNEGLWTHHMVRVDETVLNNASHVALLMDDIDASSVNVTSFLETMNRNEYDVASASIPDWHYDCMHPRAECKSHRTDFADVLFLVFTRQAWYCWQKQINVELNEFGWGYDVTFAETCNVTVGIMDESIAVHQGACAHGGDCTRSYDSGAASRQQMEWFSHVTGRPNLQEYWRHVVYKRPYTFPRCDDYRPERQKEVMIPSDTTMRNVTIDQASNPTRIGVKDVYCICPAGSMTGGPEALHQLCNEINLAGVNVDASMLYVTRRADTVIHRPDAQEPSRYNELYDSRVERDSNPLLASSPDKLLVWPEIWVKHMLTYLESTPTPCRCAIYWLSVDWFDGSFHEWHRKDILHLTQSEYARQFVINKGAPLVLPLEEYIPRIPKGIETTNRTIDVVYNPQKGLTFTNAIRERSGSMINFRPIAGTGKHLTPEQVQELLLSAKVYIDFGHHPGMDRIPREAALAGCVVITNMQGSAQYFRDVPIPPQYKIKDFNADTVHELLLDVIQNYETHSRNFDEYREWIRGQRPRMEQQVDSFLKEIY